MTLEEKTVNKFEPLERHFAAYGVTSKDPTSDEYFAAAVKIAINEYDISPVVLADSMEAAYSTIRRWADGVCCPRPHVREYVLEWLVRNIKP